MTLLTEVDYSRKEREAAVAELDAEYSGMDELQEALKEATIADSQIDFKAYMLPPDEHARIVSPLSLVNRIEKYASGEWKTQGLSLPWGKAETKVRFRPGKTSVWTGYTHHGKTLLLKHLMNHAIKMGEKVCIASMEELPEETFFDMLCQAVHSQEPHTDWIDVYANHVNNKLWFYDQQSMVDPMRMIAVMNYCAREKGVTHFVIDSLMRLDMASDDYDWQRKFFNLLGAHAKATGVHVHIVCHARKGSDENKPLSIMDIRGSGDIINQADNIFNVWRNKVPRSERKDFDANGDAVLIVEKQRGKPNWLGRFRLWMDEASGQFLAEKDDEPVGFLPYSNPPPLVLTDS